MAYRPTKVTARLPEPRMRFGKPDARIPQLHCETLGPRIPPGLLPERISKRLHVPDLEWLEELTPEFGEPLSDLSLVPLTLKKWKVLRDI